MRILHQSNPSPKKLWPRLNYTRPGQSQIPTRTVAIIVSIVLQFNLQQIKHSLRDLVLLTFLHPIVVECVSWGVSDHYTLFIVGISPPHLIHLVQSPPPTGSFGIHPGC